jgi:predicted ATPase/DNA-binding SARP family transcriptional activator
VFEDALDNAESRAQQWVPARYGNNMPARESAPRGPGVFLLGAPYVETGGAGSAFLPERRFELLAFLAYRGDWIGRDALAATFWPDQDNAAARRNLRWLVHSVRSDPGFAALEAERERVRLDAPTDVHRFDAAIREQRWSDAFALYRGTLCAGLEAKSGAPFAQWLRLERARLAEMYRRAAFALIAMSEPADAIAIAQRVLDEDAFDEPALQALLRALLACGRIADARRAYREFASRMLDELGLEPGNETRALVTDLDTGRMPSPVMSPPAPVERDSFVGRHSELTQLASLLREVDCRLLTILGPGGIGKSRLLAHALAAEREATLVPLEALTVPAQIPAQVAAALGLRLSGGEAVEQQVARRLRTGRWVLALDNFEHLIDGSKICERWLHDCPELKIVVTSRERLDLAIEWLLPLEGLGLPPGGADAAAHVSIDDSDAVRLFVERARAARPDFDLPRYRDYVRDIVALTDGMPLAIELAAAWTRVLPCDAIAQDLRKGLDILDASRPPPRPEHRSIRASFEHSWSLLLPRERTLLAALSVFRGGFTREAAHAVAGSSLPALSALVDKSLLRASREGRFSLHPLLQQFAEEKLERDAVKAKRMRTLHAEYFTYRIAASAERLRAGDEIAYAETNADLDNYLEAWRSALGHKRFDLIEQSCLALMRFYQERGLAQEGLQVLAAAASDPALQDHRGLAFAHVSASRAALLVRQGQYGEGGELAHVALKAYRVARDDAGTLRCLTTIGESLWYRGQGEKAKPYFDQILRKSRAAGDAVGAASALGYLGVLERAAGRYAESVALLDESARLYRGAGSATGLVAVLNNLGNICRLTRDFHRAHAYLDEGLTVAERHGLWRAQQYVLYNLGVVELELGRAVPAEAHAERALAKVRASGERVIETMCLCALARITAAQGKDGAAAAHLADAARVSLRSPDATEKSTVAVCAAQLLAMRGECGSAVSILSAVAESSETSEPDRTDARRELDALRAGMSTEAFANVASDAAQRSVTRLIERIADGDGLDAATSGPSPTPSATSRPQAPTP